MLTKRQRKLLNFIAHYNDKLGISPTYDEMMKHMDFKSRSSIHQIVMALLERGFLSKSTELRGAARTLIVKKAAPGPQGGSKKDEFMF